MTQPPLSSAIAQLEVDLGAKVFKRSSRGVTLTPVGEEVARFAERLATQETELRRRIEAIKGGRLGTLEIGCNPILAGTIIPQLIRAILKDEDQLDISLHEAHPRWVLEAVLNSEVDVGIIATAAVDDIRMLFGDRLRIDHLINQEMIALLPPDSEHLPNPLSLKDIAHHEFASPTNTMRHGIQFSLFDAFDRAGLPQPRIREVPSLQEAIPLITAGLAVGIMPEAIRDLVHPSRVAIRTLADGPDPFELSIVSLKERAQHPAIKRFRDVALQELCSTNVE